MVAAPRYATPGSRLGWVRGGRQLFAAHRREAASRRNFYEQRPSVKCGLAYSCSVSQAGSYFYQRVVARIWFGRPWRRILQEWDRCPNVSMTPPGHVRTMMLEPVRIRFLERPSLRPSSLFYAGTIRVPTAGLKRSPSVSILYRLRRNNRATAMRATFLPRFCATRR